MNYKVNTKEELDQFVTKNWNELNEYLNKKEKEVPLPIYSSVDIRESKNKYAPVDHNIYPAGFNNLCMLDLDATAPVFNRCFNTITENPKTIGIIPESHTKNLFYLDHLALLSKVIRDSGFEVYVLGVDQALFPNNETHLELVSQSQYDITIEKVEVDENNQLRMKRHPSVDIDIVVLNNDQSHPLKLDWDAITTPIVPTPKMGWYQRQKIHHFKYYKMVADDFCQHFDINPDLIQAKYLPVEDVDFSSKKGLDTIAQKVDELLKDLPEDSSVFVKASRGTYGMGISVVHSGDEVIQMNRKARNKMDVGKGKIKFTTILVQEGIETILKYDDMPAEVTIYLVGGRSRGGFMRANSLRGPKSNLNAKGMVFKKFCISEIRENQDHKAKESVYSIIARLATLASGHEIKDVKGYTQSEQCAY